MALIVETGAGLANAESYISVADCATYHDNIGQTAWGLLTTGEKEQSLRRATIYMLQAYRNRWAGQRTRDTQALDWPRSWVIVDGYGVNADSVPQTIKNACAELAWRAASGDLNPDLERAVIRERVGPLETEYSGYSPQQIRYRAIDQMLAPFLSGGSASHRISRT